MAKSNLKELLVSLEASSKERADYRNIVNAFAHRYDLDYTNLWKELVQQISGLSVKDKNRVVILVEQDKDLENRLKKILENYCKAIYTAFEKLKADNRYSVELVGNPKKFYADIIASSPEDIFNKVIKNRIRSRPLKALQEQVFEAIDNSLLFSEIITSSEDPGHVQRTLETRVLGRQYETKKLDKNNQPVMGRTSGLFELGHLSGSSVVEKWLRTQTAGLSEALDSLPARVIKESKVLGELKAYVKADDLKSKKIVIVYDQSSFGNKSQSSIENKIVPKLASLLTEALNSKDASFWANFETSPSLLSRIRAELVNTAIKTGAKGKLVPKAPKSTARASIEIKGNFNRTSSKESVKGKDNKVRVSRSKDNSYNNNWMRLLPLINAKLTDQVVKNMGSPKLENRSGRFARSARVVNIEQTPQGYPSIVFDYQRDPYDVFDRTLGKSPWNTPERDPRTLVDQSVREIVREMAIGRFFTRRA